MGVRAAGLSPVDDPELALILGLLALPMGTLMALAVDRRSASSAGATDVAAGDAHAVANPKSVHAGTHGPTHLPRVQMHGPSTRRERAERPVSGRV